jgi:hypothetical protein
LPEDSSFSADPNWIRRRSKILSHGRFYGRWQWEPDKGGKNGESEDSRDVDLDKGEASFLNEGKISREKIGQAIAEAGFKVSS